MTSQRECPEECKEAVSSLMYVAHEFGDLLELSQLKTLFFKRYGNSLETFVNKEFVDLLMNPDRATNDMKIQLMQEIAHEHGLEWSPESLDDELNKVDYETFLFSLDSSGNLDDKEPCIIKINIEEPVLLNNDTNAHAKDEPTDDIVMCKENARLRVLEDSSRTTSLPSRSHKTSKKREESSNRTHDSTKPRSLTSHRLMSSTYAENKKKTNTDTVHNSHANNIRKGVSNKEQRIAARQTRKDGALAHVKIHPTECTPKSAGNGQKMNTRVGLCQLDLTARLPALKEQKTSYQPVETAKLPGVKKQESVARGASNQRDRTMKRPLMKCCPGPNAVEKPKSPLPRHVHPKLPDYDDIKAQFAALRVKS